MTKALRRAGGTALALVTGLGLAACTAGHPAPPAGDPPVPAGSWRLAAFTGCDSTLHDLRAAASAAVGPYGLPGGPAMAADGRMEAGQPAAVPGAAPGAGRAVDALPDSPDHSGTNNQESGVDEPDLVKTDGRRIVTVEGGVLTVIDAASARITGRLELDTAAAPTFYGQPSQLLLTGDHALLITTGNWGGGPIPGGAIAEPAGPGAPPPATGSSTMDTPGSAAPSPGGGTAPGPVDPVNGPTLTLVDLAGTPTVLSSYRMDGGYLDARLIGGTARVVLRSAPRIALPQQNTGSDADRLRANRAAIAAAPLADFLPRYQSTTGGHTSSGTVDCAQVWRPASYSGTNMVTVLTFDLTGSSLGSGAPVTVLADGDTVYASAQNLFIASDDRWRAMPMPVPMGPAQPNAPDQPLMPTRPVEPRTEIYRFDLSGPDRPRFAGGGAVPGYLLNQYAMSQWQGVLRVATTRGADGSASRAESAVYTMRVANGSLPVLGHLGGLGRGERIYAVRYAQRYGYVVTFRQTDPLYTVDFSDPAHPALRGELKLPGFSAYLHPVGADRLLGIGQQADAQGHVRGTQVSLFNVADPAHPALLSRYTVAGARSQAEFDPHAFLYWPTTGLLVVPLSTAGGGATPGAPGAQPADGVLVLKVGAGTISEVGFLTHPARPGAYPAPVDRSLMIGDTLWTVSSGGLLATDPGSLHGRAWLALR